MKVFVFLSFMKGWQERKTKRKKERRKERKKERKKTPSRDHTLNMGASQMIIRGVLLFKETMTRKKERQKERKKGRKKERGRKI